MYNQILFDLFSLNHVNVNFMLKKQYMLYKD